MSFLQDCIGKQSCSVSVVPEVYGDPCPGTNKKLSVEVICSWRNRINTHQQYTHTKTSWSVYPSNVHAKKKKKKKHQPTGLTLEKGKCRAYHPSAQDRRSNKVEIRVDCIITRAIYCKNNTGTLDQWASLVKTECVKRRKKKKKNIQFQSHCKLATMIEKKLQWSYRRKLLISSSMADPYSSSISRFYSSVLWNLGFANWKSDEINKVLGSFHQGTGQI